VRYLILVTFLLFSLTCAAAIYMQQDKNGDVSYSDMPSPNALRVDLPPAPTTQFTTPPAAPAASKLNPKDKTSEKSTADAATSDDHVPYTAFFISSPVEQQTFQNQRDVGVDVSITPALQKGDTIQLYIDGNKQGPAASTTHFQVNQLPRGTHQASATLLDVNKATLKQAATVNFFVHYAAVGAAQ
jgi:hypothetical protein